MSKQIDVLDKAIRDNMKALSVPRILICEETPKIKPGICTIIRHKPKPK